MYCICDIGMSIRGRSIDIAGWEGEKEGGGERERRSSEEKEEQYEQVNKRTGRSYKKNRSQSRKRRKGRW